MRRGRCAGKKSSARQTGKRYEARNWESNKQKLNLKEKEGKMEKYAPVRQFNSYYRGGKEDEGKLRYESSSRGMTKCPFRSPKLQLSLSRNNN